MKVGDKFPVSIAGHKVADAEVREVGEGTVTLVVPGTLVTMSTRTEIAPETPEEKVETGSDHQILGVEQDGVPGLATPNEVREQVGVETIDPAEHITSPAPVGEETPNTNSEQNDNQDASTD